MTVGELIEELKKYPEEMPVAVDGCINYPPEYEGNKIELTYSHG